MPHASVDYFSYSYVANTGASLSILTRGHVLNLHILFLSIVSDFFTKDNCGVCQGLLYMNFFNPSLTMVIHSNLSVIKNS